MAPNLWRLHVLGAYNEFRAGLVRTHHAAEDLSALSIKAFATPLYIGSNLGWLHVRRSLLAAHAFTLYDRYPRGRVCCRIAVCPARANPSRAAEQAVGMVD